MQKSISGLNEGWFDSIYLGDISSIYSDPPYTINLPNAKGSSGQVLTTSGVKATYWSSITDVIGVLPVVNGGTGVSLSTGTTRVVLSNSPTITSPSITTPTIGGLMTITTPFPAYTYLFALSTGGGSYITPSIAGDLVIRPLDFSAATFISGAADASNYVQFCKPGDTSIKVVKVSPQITLQRIGGSSGVFGIANGTDDIFDDTLTNDLCIKGDNRIRLRSTNEQIYMHSPVNFYNDQYSSKLKVTCETTAGYSFSGVGWSTSIGDAVLKSDQSLYMGSPGNQIHLVGEGVYFNGVKTPIGQVTYGIDRYYQTGSQEYISLNAVGTVATVYAIVGSGEWDAGDTIKGLISGIPEVGETTINTTITTSLFNNPAPGYTKITFTAPVPNGDGYRFDCLPAPVGKYCYNTAGTVTAEGYVPLGIWVVGEFISGTLNNFAGTFETINTPILTVSPDTPSLGITRITFLTYNDATPLTMPDGYYSYNLTPSATNLQYWGPYSNVDFKSFIRDTSYGRGLTLGYTYANYGRFVNPYSFAISVTFSYKVARLVFEFPTTIPNQVPYDAFLSAALVATNGQTATWVEQNDDSRKIAQGAAPSAQTITNTAIMILDPGEYFQLRGYNNSPLPSGIWGGCECFVLISRVGN